MAGFVPIAAERSTFRSHSAEETTEFIREMYVGNRTSFSAVTPDREFTADLAGVGRMRADRVSGDLTLPTPEDHHDAHPATVRRAIAYIDTHLGHAIALVDIAAAAHVSTRARCNTPSADTSAPHPWATCDRAASTPHTANSWPPTPPAAPPSPPSPPAGASPTPAASPPPTDEPTDNTPTQPCTPETHLRQESIRLTSLEMRQGTPRFFNRKGSA